MSYIKSIFDPYYFDILCEYELDDYVFENKPTDDLIIKYPVDAEFLEMTIGQCKKELLKHRVLKAAAENKANSSEELRVFLERMLPYDPVNEFYLFVKESESLRVNIPQTRQQHIDTLCAITDIPYTLYYHLTPFTVNTWTKDKNAQCYRSICIDIDGFEPGFDMLTCEKEELLAYLIETYDLHDKPLPDAICCSGHGCHLYFQIPQTYEENFPKRQRYLNSMLVYFSGDFKTNNKGRKFRLPLSYNRKNGERVKSRLILFDEPEDISFERLDLYLKTEEEFAVFRAAGIEKENEKKAKTRTENAIKAWMAEGYSREDAEELAKNPPPKPKKPKAPKTEKPKKEPKKKSTGIKESKDDYYFDFSELTYRRNYNGKGPAAILLVDLHNYLCRNGDDCLRGQRNSFFFILATAGLEVFTKDRMDDFIDYCETYCDKDNPFYNEMCNIIRNVFTREKVCHFKYTTIREWLNLSEEDIRASRSCFTPEIRAQRRKQYDHECYQKKKATQVLPLTKQRKTECLEYMQNNPTAKEKDIRYIFGIGHNTFYRYKKELQL